MTSARRESYALLASSLGSGLATFAFWTLVAHVLGAQRLGAASAQVATVIFIGGAASLNMVVFLSRFSPHAGHKLRQLVLICYGAALLSTAAAASLFLVTPLGHSSARGPIPGPLFVLLCMVMCLFTIEDGVLIGTGRARWVMMENIGAATLRICLVVALMAVGTEAPVIAFGGAATIVVGIISYLIFTRVTPRQTGAPQLPPRRQMVSFVGIEAVTSALTSAHDTFLPALATVYLGKTAGGYFYVPWLVVTTFALLTVNVMLAAVRGIVVHPEGGIATLIGQLRLVAVIVALGTLGCSVYPELPLSILGGDIASHAVGVTRWFGLSLLGTALSTAYWAMCLVQGKALPTFVVNLAKTCGTVIPLVVLGKDLGVDGLGALYCGVQWSVGLLTLPFLMREVRLLHLRAALATSPGPAAQ